MKISISFLAIFLFLSFFEGKSQNLVTNGDFENASSYPDFYGQSYYCIGWSNLNGGYTWPDASPDYLSTLGFSPVRLPNTAFGTVSPYSGNSIMGLVTKLTTQNNFREYISTQFSSPMSVGQTYTISFWLTNGGAPYYGGNSSDHFGIYLSKTPPVQFDHEPVGVTPQLEIPGEPWSTTWQQYTFSFTANDNYEYITFGNFYDDNSTTSTPREASSYSHAYYYIDKVEVLPSGPPQIVVLGDSIICSGESVTLEAYNSTSYTWVDIADPSVVLSTNASITVQPTATTTYLITGTDNSVYFTVYVSHGLDFNLGNDTSICANTTLELNAGSPHSFYLWQDNSTLSTYTVTEPGVYWVERIWNGCPDRDTIIVAEHDCPVILKIPNLFTPDHDQWNDVFTPIQCEGIIKLHTTLYNRWGSKVYETEELKINWDGLNASDGIYYWVIDYTDVFRNENRINGYVVITR